MKDNDSCVSKLFIAARKVSLSKKHPATCQPLHGEDGVDMRLLMTSKRPRFNAEKETDDDKENDIGILKPRPSGEDLKLDLVSSTKNSFVQGQGRILRRVHLASLLPRKASMALLLMVPVLPPALLLKLKEASQTSR